MAEPVNNMIEVLESMVEAFHEVVKEEADEDGASNYVTDEGKGRWMLLMVNRSEGGDVNLSLIAARDFARMATPFIQNGEADDSGIPVVTYSVRSGRKEELVY